MANTLTEVGEDMREKGFRICQEFLGEAWKTMSTDDFHIEYISVGLNNMLLLCTMSASVQTRGGEPRQALIRIHGHLNGGLSNMLYMCAMSDCVKSNGKEPRVAMLRMYGNIIKQNPEMVVTDSVVFALLAEKKMGPKLYGVFTGGRVEEYIQSRHLYTEELRKPSISTACAQIMVQFHKLKMPLCKAPSWLFNTTERYLDEALCISPYDADSQEDRKKLEKIFDYDLAAELQCLKRILSRVYSPVVFCHNDLQEGNILLKEDGKKWKIMAIDFEYASYNYRGFDIGNHFCEWCYDYSVKESPYFSASLDLYPTRDQQLLFIRAYLEEECREDHYDCAALEEQMLLEAQAYALASHMLWALWSIVQFKMSKIQFGYLDYALVRLDHYTYQKKQLAELVQVNGE